MSHIDYYGPDLEEMTRPQLLEQILYLSGRVSELENFVNDAFNAHPNLDLDIEANKRHEKRT